MRTITLLSTVAGLALVGVLSAEEAAKPAAAAAAKPAAAAEAKPATAKAEAAAEATPVVKNDAMGSLKAGKELLDAGKFAEAVAYFDAIGEQVADNGASAREPFRQLNLSTAYLGLEKYAEAGAAAQKAIDAKSGLAAAWNNLAASQVRSGKRADAVATYEKAIAAVKKKEGDTSKLEANLTELKNAIEAGKPKKVREAEAKAKAEADAAKVKADAEAEAAKAKPAAEAEAKK